LTAKDIDHRGVDVAVVRSSGISLIRIAPLEILRKVNDSGFQPVPAEFISFQGSLVDCNEGAKCKETK
jgi:hypothetical protein